MTDYEDIVMSKYSRVEMRDLFSERNTIHAWRKCWVALAEAERELGLKQISKAMIDEMNKNIDNIDFNAAKQKEEETQHDVMAHIYAYGLSAPSAKGIIHLGATSQCIKCNTDLILQYHALILIRKGLTGTLKNFWNLIQRTKKIPTLSYTHYQPAQPTTIGRRFCIYAQDFLMDIKELDSILDDYALRGVKGATGTQASFLKLLENKKKVSKLDILFAKKLGFKKVFPITTQTYTRKFDIRIASLLASIAATCKKFATDMRLLANLGVIEEPFSKKQTGSSAMPYKRNPMMCERISSLSRKVINNLKDFYDVYSEQWLERTLDDSAIRRIDIPQNFMLTDYLLIKLSLVLDGLVVNEQQSIRLLEDELPFLASEDILMECVKKGADRQKIHEIIKLHAFDAAKRLKEYGGENDLLARLASDKSIGLSINELKKMLSINSFIGLSIEQTDVFCNKFLKKYR